MKKKLLLFVLSFGFTFLGQAQVKITKTKSDEFEANVFPKQAVDNYLYDVSELRRNPKKVDTIISIICDGIKQIKVTKVIDTIYEKNFSEKFMNIFFADVVSQYVTTTKDLTLQKASAFIDTNEKTLFVGGSFYFLKNEQDKLTNLLTVGAKAKIDGDFATIFEDNKIKSEIGLNIKWTRIGRGVLNYRGAIKDKSFRQIIDDYRYDKLKKKYMKEAKDYIDQEFNDNVEKMLSVDCSDTKRLADKADELYKKMATDEMNFIKKNKLYKFFSDSWFTVEVYVPLSTTPYTMAESIDTVTVKTVSKDFCPWKTSIGWTYFRKYASGVSCYVSVFGTVKNNNTIITALGDKVSEVEVQTVNTVNSNVIVDTKKYYSGIYNEFVTPSISAEITSFIFLDGTFGFSAGADQNFGKYDALNWKLGIPFSLKDKEGKPTVNFEIAWKELNKEHFVGINVGFTFGKTIQ